MNNHHDKNNSHQTPMTGDHQTGHADPYLAQQLQQQQDVAGLQDQNENPSSVLNRHLLVGGAASSNVSLLLAQQQEQLYHQQRQQEQLHLMMSLLQGTRNTSQQNSEIGNQLSSRAAGLLHVGGGAEMTGPSSGNPNSHPPNICHGALPNLLRNNSDAATAGSASAKKKKKKRKKKNKNQRNRPSRPLSAYNLFFKDERKQILSETTKCDKDAVDDHSSDNADGSNSEEKNSEKPSKGIGFENLAKTIGRRWKKISPERLEHYKALAKKDQDRYAVDMKASRAVVPRTGGQ